MNKKARTGDFGKLDDAEEGGQIGWNLKNTVRNKVGTGTGRSPVQPFTFPKRKKNFISDT